MYGEKQEDRFYRAVTCLLLGLDYLPDLKNVKSTDQRNCNQIVTRRLNISALRRFKGPNREHFDPFNKYSLYRKSHNVNNKDYRNISRRHDHNFPREPNNSFYNEHFFK